MNFSRFLFDYSLVRKYALVDLKFYTETYLTMNSEDISLNQNQNLPLFWANSVLYKMIHTHKSCLQKCQYFWSCVHTVAIYNVFWLGGPRLLYILCFVVVNFDALALASDIRILRRQVVFLCWIQDSNPGSQTPDHQQTEYPIMNYYHFITECLYQFLLGEFYVVVNFILKISVHS